MGLGVCAVGYICVQSQLAICQQTTLVNVMLMLTTSLVCRILTQL